ncbi:hypothetical protein DKX38_015616 [Salix brachista]|uniref:Uncharacterized protein n=1 Tax=Salix brachista TaxID=2182728 RepID=A0A5N5L5Q6_9ROSI|nr:hypothetical protein DKX38_015616 [Salix brachista]
MTTTLSWIDPWTNILIVSQLKIRNDFDPVLSPESSLFVLKSNKQVADQDTLKILDPVKLCSSVQNFIDIYLRLPGLPTNGQLAESDCIRILIEVDHLQDTPSPYLQIKGVNKEAVTAAGSTLKLDGSYTTKLSADHFGKITSMQRSYSAIHAQQAARLQELVEFIQSQGSASASESSPSRDAATLEGKRLSFKRLERWNTINTVLWTFLMSAPVGYSLYQRKHQ